MNGSANQEGKVALVTGGGSGIGLATAKLFAVNNAKVVVADWSIENGEKTASTIKESGGDAAFVHVDVSNSSMVEEMVNFAKKTYGRIDYAFNNAGIDQPGRPLLDEMPEEDWNKVIGIDLSGVFLSMKYELVQMRKQGSGVIINASSGAGIKGVPNMGAYCAAKHGVIGLTRSAALDYARQNIRVNAICPGLIKTNLIKDNFEANPGLEETYISMQPMGRIGDPSEVAETVLWLCSDAASLMNGAIITVDGGFAAQ
jgi:NAD(P)-dependent dehydrogenase (short-subunit alcohol dehydrogenase family)